jgi:hypothetical protein
VESQSSLDCAHSLQGEELGPRGWEELLSASARLLQTQLFCELRPTCSVVAPSAISDGSLDAN